MRPAQQGLEPGDPVVAEVDDRLVAQVELAPLERVVQLVLEQQPSGDPLAHRRVEQRRPRCRRGPWPGTSRCRRCAAWPRRRCPRAGSCTVTPTLTEIGISASRTRNGVDEGQPGPLGHLDGVLGCRGRRSTTMTNSSPPIRPTRSSGRMFSRSRSATATSSSSPMLWPIVSLTSLNRSRSRNSRATDGSLGSPVGPSPVRSVSSSVRYWCRYTRLGSPVRASWVAWWARRVAESACSRSARNIRQPAGGGEGQDDGGQHDPVRQARRRRAVRVSTAGTLMATTTSTRRPGLAGGLDRRDGHGQAAHRRVEHRGDEQHEGQGVGRRRAGRRGSRSAGCRRTCRRRRRRAGRPAST